MANGIKFYKMGKQISFEEFYYLQEEGLLDENTYYHVAPLPPPPKSEAEIVKEMVEELKSKMEKLEKKIDEICGN